MTEKHPEVKRKGRQIDMSDIDCDPIVMFYERYRNVKEKSWQSIILFVSQQPHYIEIHVVLLHPNGGSLHFIWRTDFPFNFLEHSSLLSWFEWNLGGEQSFAQIRNETLRQVFETVKVRSKMQHKFFQVNNTN